MGCVVLKTEMLLVGFPVMAHARVVGQVPSWGHVRGRKSMFLSDIDVSLLLFLPPLLPL